jgi:hypothetical protein
MDSVKLPLALALFAGFLPGAGPAPADRLVQGSGITVAYDAADFSSHSWKQEPKLTAQDIGTDIPEGVGPAHPVLLLSGLSGSRRDPEDNRISFIPLSDPSVPDFAKAYPGLQSSAAKLRALLAAQRIPTMRQLNAADPELVDSEYSFCTRVERIDTPAVSGFAYLAQFTQELHPDPANNRELTYVFLGITAGGRYLVEANFAVGHPSLPKTPGEHSTVSLPESVRQLPRFDEISFQPPLPRLKALLRSISVAR